MKRIIAVVFTLLCSAALAQGATGVAPQACTVTYSTECETADGNDCGMTTATLPMLPYADVLDNAQKFKRVLDAASRVQDKNGPYTVQMNETRVCDGGTAQKAQGIEVRGVTLAGANHVVRESLAQFGKITERYEQRAAKGEKMAWDHKKAKKVERDDVGKRKPDKDK